MTQEVNLKYRTWYKGQPPRQIKLEIPGWSGEKTWDLGQPWHCKPFADGATYGLEIIYPFQTEVVVTNENGEAQFHCESKSEWEDVGVVFPFRCFAPHHFGFTSSLDIQTEEGFGSLILPHSRYFTDMQGTVPLPSIGLLESDWWPKVFFIAFRAPLEGQKYVFKYGEGIAQILIVPKSPKYNIEKMSREEARLRSDQEKMLAKHGGKIANKTWTDKQNFTFDNKYKVLSQMNQRCPGSATSLIESMKVKESDIKTDAEDKRRQMLTRTLIKRKK